MRRMERKVYFAEPRQNYLESEDKIMTYAMSLNNSGFAELSLDEMLFVDGGTWWQVALCGVAVAAGVALVVIAAPAVIPAVTAAAATCSAALSGAGTAAGCGAAIGTAAVAVGKVVTGAGVAIGAAYAGYKSL